MPRFEKNARSWTLLLGIPLLASAAVVALYPSEPRAALPRPKVTCTGRVVHSDGTPLKGRMVALEVDIDAAKGEMVMPFARTNDQGEFRLPDVPLGSCRLFIPAGKDRDSRDDSYYAASGQIEDATAPWSIALPSGPELSGQLLEARRTPGATLRIGLCPILPAPLHHPALVAVTSPDAHGHFLFRAVPPGRYVLVAHLERKPAEPPHQHVETAPPQRPPSEGSPAVGCFPPESSAPAAMPTYVTLRQTVVVDAAPIRDFSISFPEGVFNGTIVAPGDLKVSDASVLFLDENMPAVTYHPRFLPNGSCAAFTQANAAGEFSFPALAPGTYHVRVTERQGEYRIIADGSVRVHPDGTIELDSGLPLTLARRL
ncbi:MAG: carboxypeptidase regulatory-like domain-containing protein [Planctomycetes bacterium]|nr:carboxypeptidase regulatory-like domain-containing protein [Planctomycetota bacterium]